MEVSIYRVRHRDLLTLCVLALLCLGAVMVQSASTTLSGEVKWAWSQRGTRHLVYAGVAALAFLLVGHIDYAALARRTTSVWRSPALWGLALALVLCAAVLVPGVGKDVNGARRWINLGPVQVQPSEIAKWATVLYLAWWLARRPLDLDKFFFGFLPTIVPIGAVCLLVVIEDFGTAALIGLCALAICLAAGVKLWHFALLAPPAAAAAVWFVVKEPYRMRRMLSFLDPWASPDREGYHMVQSLMSFATGGIMGKGLGRGVQKLGYLPEDTTDFIFAVICEELGLFGAMFVIALYCGILFVAWQAIRQKKAEPFAQLIAFGVAAMVGLQALINIAVATVSVPPKGMSLPLISAGGSGLVITCAALGLLSAVCRQQEDAELGIQPHRPEQRGFEVLPKRHRAAAA